MTTLKILITFHFNPTTIKNEAWGFLGVWELSLECYAENIYKFKWKKS